MTRKTQAIIPRFSAFLGQIAPPWAINLIQPIPRWFAWVLFDLRANHLRLHTAGLVYTSILTMVPMLAVLFTLLKTFEAHLWVEPFLLQYLSPLGAGKSLQMTEQLMQFITNTRVGVLGTVSMGILLLAVVKMAQQLEHAFNSIWFVAKPRPWWRCAKETITLMMLAPILLALTLGASTASKHWDALNRVFGLPLLQDVALRGLALLPVILTLTFLWLIYLWVPNTRIGKKPALVGAMTAWVLWQVMGKLFKLFVAGSGQYEAIYSGFAAAILFVMWLYFSWLIVLLGAQISYWVQHHYQWQHTPQSYMTPALRLHAALQACTIIAHAHHQGRLGPSVDDLSRQLHLTPGEIITLMTPLLNARLLVQDPHHGLVPQQATHKVSLQKLVAALQGSAPPASPPLNTLCRRLLEAQQKAAGKATWADLDV